jgi:hypothetical protein
VQLPIGCTCDLKGRALPTHIIAFQAPKIETDGTGCGCTCSVPVLELGTAYTHVLARQEPKMQSERPTQLGSVLACLNERKRNKLNP